MRMCSPRRSAITAPSIESQRNRIEASSSDQISGLWKTYRMMTPASMMPISTSTTAAAAVSTTAPSQRSTAPKALASLRVPAAEAGCAAAAR
ncbi:hypothetical protein ABIF79_005269 [Bradyrhizobium japonicum]